jgi:prolyl oligopeptidase
MKLQYPKTRKVEQYDDYFGTVVADPYRWLEEDTEEVAQWVREQNAVTEAYLSQIPFREQLRERVRELMNFPRYSSAKKIGNKYIFLYNDGLQEQSVLLIQDGFEGQSRVLLDPNTFSVDQSLTLSSFVVSNDRKYMTYSIAEAGSDWTEVSVMNIETEQILPDQVQNVFAPPSWIPHWYKDGFFYSQWGDPKTGTPDVEHG